MEKIEALEKELASFKEYQTEREKFLQDMITGLEAKLKTFEIDSKSKAEKILVMGLNNSQFRNENTRLKATEKRISDELTELKDRFQTLTTTLDQLKLDHAETHKCNEANKKETHSHKCKIAQQNTELSKYV